jgi:hypothetical protein
MGRIRFDDLFARLSRRERVAFVGALLSAQGWHVDADPPVIRATKGDRCRVVAVARDGLVRGPGLPQAPLDAVVGVDAERTQRLARERDARAWDARTLYDMARHGLDPEATDRLFADHFGETNTMVGRPVAPRADPDGTDGADESDGKGVNRERRTGVTDSSPAAATGLLAGRSGQWVIPSVLVVVIVLGGALTAQALIGLPPVDAASEGAGASGSTDDTTPSGSVSTVRPTPTPEPRTIVPGLSQSGIVDTAALARGHATALTNRSFTMRLTYTEQVDGETVGRAREVVRVEGPTVYRSTGTRSGNLTSDLQPVIVRDLYADGDGRYLRQGDGALRVGDADDPGTGRVVERSRALVAWYLSGADSTLVGSTRHPTAVYYRVGVEGTSDRRFDDYQASGLVSEHGLIVRVDARYRLSGTDRTASVSLRYTDVGTTTVPRPDWMPPSPPGNESTG